MATVTGLTAARMLAIEAASIDQAALVGDNLVLTNHADVVVLNANVRGPAGPTGPTGPTGGVATGGYVGTLQDAVDDGEAYTDLAGKGLVAMDDYTATDITKSGADDSFHTVDNVSVTYSFVTGRSYRIDFGMQVQFEVLSTDDQVISLDLREGTNTVRRVTIPGDTEGHTSGIVGAHLIQSSAWSGNKTLTMRFQKRTGSDITIKNTTMPSFIAVTDIGGRFV
jgi:hypothetical protein